MNTAPDTAPDTRETVIRWQYCQSGYDITDMWHDAATAEEDSDVIRAWAGAHGDFCYAEVTRVTRGRGTGRWILTGGDGAWSGVGVAVRRNGSNITYGTPADALTAVLGAGWREATDTDTE